MDTHVFYCVRWHHHQTCGQPHQDGAPIPLHRLVRARLCRTHDLSRRMVARWQPRHWGTKLILMQIRCLSSGDLGETTDRLESNSRLLPAYVKPRVFCAPGEIC